MSLPNKIILLLLAVLALGLAGCIADLPEDRDLPWATNQGWEGTIPMPGFMNQYD